MQRDSVRPYIWMLMGCMAFTTMNALVHRLRQDCDWQIIALFRTGLAFLFAVLLAWLAGAKLVVIGPASLWIRSLAGSVSLGCAFFALTRQVPLSNVQAITYMFPIWVNLLAWPMLGHKPGWSGMLAVFAAVVGVFLIGAPKLGRSGDIFDLEDESALAAYFAVVASFFTAVAMLGLNRLHWIDTRAVVAHFSGVAMLFCIGALICFEREYPVGTLVDPTIMLLLLGMGAVATIGQIFLTKAFTIGQPAKVSVVSLTQIVMMLLVDVCLFDVRFTWSNLLGIALVIVPTGWIILSRSRQSGVAGGES